LFLYNIPAGTGKFLVSQFGKMKESKVKSLSALSLVEILVSILIFSLVMSGFVNLFISGKRFIMHSRWRMTAGELGKYFLDPLQMDVRQDTWNNPSSNNLSAPSPLTNTSLFIDTKNYTANYTVTNVTVNSSQVRKVKLRIIWNESFP